MVEEQYDVLCIWECEFRRGHSRGSVATEIKRCDLNKKGDELWPEKRHVGSFEYMGQGKKWTEEEKVYLQDNWGTVSIGTIMKNLNRTRNAINVMAQRLGLGAFLDCGDYITFNQLSLAVLGTTADKYKQKSWVQNRDFPMHIKRVGDNSFRIVYIEEFWEWAEKNRDFLDFSKFEENILGEEPAWAKEKRKQDIKKKRRWIKTPWTPAEDEKLRRLLRRQQYTYKELSGILRRTEGAIQKRINDLKIKERPIKADNHIKWTESEFQTLGELIKAGYGYELISEKIGKSAKSIRGKVYSMYLTENIDKARLIIGNGNWGDNRPERKIKQWNVMNTQERTEVRDLIIRLAAVLHYEFREQLKETEWGEFFQKDMCENFSSECFHISGCDECDHFKRIKPQACKMCGKTFYERKENTYCASCRNMRKKQWLRKRAALAGR